MVKKLNLQDQENSKQNKMQKETTQKETVQKETVQKKLVIREGEFKLPEKKIDKKELKEESEKKRAEEISKETTNDHISESIKLYYGDCLEKMSLIPDESVDLILCDLPYGTTKCKWDTIIDLKELWKQYKRVIKKPHGVILLFGQQPFTSMLVSSNYEWFKYNLIWKKNKTTQFLLANYRPMKCTEDICVFSIGGAAAASREKGNMTYNPQGLVSVDIKKKNSEKRIGKMLNQAHHLGPNNKLISNTEYSQKFTNYPNELIEFDIEYDTIHETQKPVKLIEYLIRTYSNEGNTVLDNTMGSGTTGIGCIRTNRKFIGIEILEKYYKLSKHRILSELTVPEPVLENVLIPE
jgi:site-specific DNA-methyltransferase (adenine-specific)